MRGMTIVQTASPAVCCVLFLACAARTPAPADATSVESEGAATSPAAPSDSESVNSGHSLDVGMEFEDKGEEKSHRLSHDAPPTATWKPVEKQKATEPRKPTTTALR